MIRAAREAIEIETTSHRAKCRRPLIYGPGTTAPPSLLGGELLDLDTALVAEAMVLDGFLASITFDDDVFVRDRHPAPEPVTGSQCVEARF